MAFGLLFGVHRESWAEGESQTESHSRDDLGTFHPPIRLFDASGQNVLASGEPVCAEKTCGMCHDVEYIGNHCYHADLGIKQRFLPGQSATASHPWDYTNGGVGDWNPLIYRRLSPPGDSNPDMGLADWLRSYGFRYVGGYLSQKGFVESRLDSGKKASSSLDTATINSSEDIGDIAAASAGNTQHDPPQWDPNRYSVSASDGAWREWDWQQSGTLELNCFLCHVPVPDNERRIDEIERGRFKWATTATLAKTGILRSEGEKWFYHPQAFDERGYVRAAEFRLVRPTSFHCGQCHGKVSVGDGPCFDMTLSDWSTLTKGQVFSPQRICEASLNLANKRELTRPWDVHAAALLECRHCHFSLDNPSFFGPPGRGRPSHLRFEPRRLSFGDYLKRPSHQLAKGDTPQGSIAPHLSGTMRTCRDCHEAATAHSWLPFRAVHLARIDCETCHIPAVHAPALQTIDWTWPQDGKPELQWRGILTAPSDSIPMVTGFRPVILPRQTADGTVRLGPYNLILALYWTYHDGVTTQPVRLSDLERITGGIVGSKTTEAKDLLLASLSTESRQSSADNRPFSEKETRLKAAGLDSPRPTGELWPFALHHGVAPAKMAIRRCETCHSSRSALGQNISLGRVDAPQLAETARIIRGVRIPEAYAIELNRENSELSLRPLPEKAGFYVLGKSRHWWVELIGLLSLLAVTLAIGTHAALRVYVTWVRNSPPT